jgi:TatD DNase family protein
VQKDDPNPVESRWIDIGANLTNRAFKADLESVLEQASAVGVQQIVVTGTSVDESRAALALAHAFPNRLFATAGVHPHDARHWGDQCERELRTLMTDSKVRAAGETGLDFNRDFSPRPAQERVFEAQLELAVESGLPVFVHERDASARVAAMLKSQRHRLADAVVHCFTGDRSALRAYLDLDLYIGITGWVCDERRSQSLQRCIADIPDDRLMLETDAPYLLPRTLRPKPKRNRNMPAYLPHVGRQVAHLRQQSVEHIARVTRHNAQRFFRLPSDRVDNDPAISDQDRPGCC